MAVVTSVLSGGNKFLAGTKGPEEQGAKRDRSLNGGCEGLFPGKILELLYVNIAFLAVSAYNSNFFSKWHIVHTEHDITYGWWG